MRDEIMKTLTTPHGRQVSETITDSGVTGWMDTSIPQDALRGWREQLLRRMAADIHAQHAEEMIEIERLREA